MRGMIVLSGSSHPELAKEIMARLGLPLGRLILQKFANQEIGVEIQQSIRDKDVYVIQTSFGEVNDYLMELLILVHACKIASAARVTAVLPCFPYSRHVLRPVDKPLGEAITARQKSLIEVFRQNLNDLNGYRPWAARTGRLVASMIESAGADHVITMDLHNPQVQGFFAIPLDNLPIDPLMIKYIVRHIPDYKNAIIVSPDAGGAKRATELANSLGTDFALIHETCTSANNEPNDNNLVLVGNVQGREAIIIDDMADTTVTLVQAAKVLKQYGASKIYAAISHGIFSGDSIKLMNDSNISEIIVSNTVPQQEHATACDKLRVFDISPILAEAIRRAHNGESISYLFSPDAFK